MKLILIRHAETQPDATIPSNEWRLSGAGRASCEALAEQLRPYNLSRLISSIEPKAIETAQLTARHLGISSEIAFGLHEHDRSNIGYLSKDRFQSLIRELFEKPEERIFGLESGVQALARFSAAVAQLAEQYSDETLGIVTHGTVLSLFVADQQGIDAFDFWQSLKMPDVVVMGDG